MNRWESRGHGGSNYSRGCDRSEAGRDNFMAQFYSGMNTLQLSVLGLVARQDVPHHLSILFSAW